MPRSYADLKSRVDELAASLLPAQSIVGNFTLKQRDLIRSYVLLAHAELEAFCEDVVLHVVKEAERRSIPTRCAAVVSRLVLYQAASCNRELDILSEEMISDACDYFRAQVSQNHGIKRRNFLSLFLPIGLNHHDFDETLLANLDAFGTQRGAFAHRSFKMDQPLDPGSEKARVEQILPEISRIDQIARGLIRL